MELGFKTAFFFLQDESINIDIKILICSYNIIQCTGYRRAGEQSENSIPNEHPISALCLRLLFLWLLFCLIFIS